MFEDWYFINFRVAFILKIRTQKQHEAHTGRLKNYIHLQKLIGTRTIANWAGLYIQGAPYISGHHISSHRDYK